MVLDRNNTFPPNQRIPILSKRLLLGCIYTALFPKSTLSVHAAKNMTGYLKNTTNIN